MTTDGRAWRFEAAQSGRSGAERRGSTDRRQTRNRRAKNQHQNQTIVVDLRIGFDRRTLRDRRSTSKQRRQGQPVWSPARAR
jgi:hypothetical protein